MVLEVSPLFISSKMDYLLIPQYSVYNSSTLDFAACGEIWCCFSQSYILAIFTGQLSGLKKIPFEGGIELYCI